MGGSDIAYADGALLATGPIGTSTVALPGSTDIRVYTVREGDTLSHIAELFGITVNTVLWANDLSKTATIQPGDELIILPVAGVKHEVVSGDTLLTIAGHYEGDANEILEFNNLTDADELAIGDELIIPGGIINTARQTPTALPTVTITGDTSGGSGGFIHPVPGATRTQGLHGNNAIDFAAGYGTTIRSAAAGEVIVSKQSGWNGGYGQYVVVRHTNGTQTLYAHLSQNYVGVGAYVAQGEAVGAMGSTGRSTGTHLHFEVRGARNPF